MKLIVEKEWLTTLIEKSLMLDLIAAGEKPDVDAVCEAANELVMKLPQLGLNEIAFARKQLIEWIE